MSFFVSLLQNIDVMMLLKRYTVLVLCLCVCLGAASQAGKRKRRLAVSETAADPRVEQMIHNTQRIMFIDSVVVTRKEAVTQLSLTPQAGHIRQDAQHLCHENEIGSRRIYSDDAGRLLMQTKTGGEWGDERELAGLREPGVIDTLRCPFMMNDGMTLYFAAKGSESIGGYDIFVTRYDTDTHTFLKPENVGMPFNSTADDLFYVIDEGARVGYFATTRHQPEGMACIYSFIPPTTRQTYAEGYDLHQLKGLAEISSIADTWSNEKERINAQERMLQAQRQPRDPVAESAVRFAVDGNTVYSSPSDFKAPGNADRFRQLLYMQKEYGNQQEELTKSRNYYAKAAQSERPQLADDIARAERELEDAELAIRQLEKEIRNIEVQFLNH